MTNFTKRLFLSEITSVVIRTAVLAFLLILKSMDAEATLINVYPQTQTRWTGSVTQNGAISTSSVMFTRGGTGSSSRDRAWMKFDLTVIPPGSTINNVTLKYFITSMNNPSLQFRKVTNDPVTAAGTVLWTQIGSGTNYLSVTNSTTGWNTKVIPGTTIKTDIANAIANGWFALGMYEYTNYYFYDAYADGWNQQNKPYLIIDYTSNLQDDISLDSISSPVNFDCEGLYPVTLKVTNAGTNPINSVLITWAVNSVSQSPVNYVFPLPLISGNTSYITLNTLQFNSGNYIIQATLANPNGNPDPFTLNNSKTVLLVITPKPSIYMQPTNQNIGVGGDAMFSTVGSGGSITYQWQLSVDGGATFNNLLNISPHSNVTSPNMNITAAPQSMNGYLYRCVVTGSCPPPAITDTVMLSVGPPVSVTAGHGYACIGQTAIVPVIVEDANNILGMKFTLNYQPGNVTFNSSSNNPVLSGNGSFVVNAAGGQITITWTGSTPLNLINDTICKLNFTYNSNSTLIFDTLTSGNCKVTGASGAVLPSNYFNGNITTAEPGIITQPNNQLAVAGQPTFFRVIASGVPAYQWQVSINNGTTWNDLLATNPTYSGVHADILWVLEPTLQMTGYRYRCILSSCGNSVTSNAAVMSVIKLVKTWLDTIYDCTCYTPPRQILVPIHVSNFDSVNSVSISFFYKNTAIQYDTVYWMNPVFSLPVLNIVYGSPYDNFRFASLKTMGYWAIPDTVPLMILKFNVLCDTTKMSWEVGACTYSTGSIEFPYAFDSEWKDGFVLDGGPTVITQPSNTTIYAGNNATFTCSGLTYNSALSYQWQSSPTGNDPWTNLPNSPPYLGANSAVLTVYTSSTAMNGYHFRCLINGLCDPVYTNDAILTINAPPIYATIPVIAACQGDTIVVPVNVANFSQVCKVKLTLQYNNTLYTYDSYSDLNASLPPSTTFTVNAVGNTITITWEAASQGTITGTDAFIKLRFTSTQLFTGSPVTFTTGPTLCYFKNCSNVSINAEYSNSTVSVNPVPIIHNVITPFPGAGHYCTGDLGVLIQMDITQPGVNYALYFNNQLVPGYGGMEGTGFGITFNTFSNTGLYTVTAYYPATGCSIAMDGFVNVVADTAPTLFSITPSGSAPYCTGGTGIPLGLSGSQMGKEYLLFRNNIEPPETILQGTGSALSFGNITTPGTYTVVARNAGYQTCLRNMNGSTVITIHDPTIPTQTDFPVICHDGPPYILTGGLPPGGSYSGPGVSGGYFNPANVAGVGTYTITYTFTDSAGCTGSIDKPITVADYPGISGGVTYDNATSTPLGNVQVMLKNANNVILQTTVSSTVSPFGSYEFRCLTANTTYNLACTTTKAFPTSEVNAQDALKILRYSVGLDTLSLLRRKAADVNASNSVNAVDPLLVVRRWAGAISSFPAGDWLFNPWLFNPVNLGNTSVIKNIKGICFGDVNGSAHPNDSLLGKIRPSVILEKEGITATQVTHIIEIPVKVKRSLLIGSVSLAINLPAEAFEVLEIRSPLRDFIWNQVENQVRFAWYSLEPSSIAGGDPLLTLIVRINSKNNIPGFLDLEADAISVITDDLANAYQGVELSVPSVKILEPSDTPGESKGVFTLEANQPNPFSTFTMITYTLPENGEVYLNILNVLGEEVSVIVKGQQIAGKYAVKFEGSGLTPGMYISKLVLKGTNSQYSQSRPMMLMK